MSLRERELETHILGVLAAVVENEENLDLFAPVLVD